MEPKPEAISLENAERLEREGKESDAVLEYVRAWQSIRGRTDFEAAIGEARIAYRLYRLRAWEVWKDRPDIRDGIAPFIGDAKGAALLARAAKADLHVLTEISPEEAKTEVCARLADIFLRKAEDPDLPLSHVNDPLLRKILLGEIAAIYEHRYLTLVSSAPRRRLARIFMALEKGYVALAMRPRARTFAANRWQEIAESYRELALATEKDSLLPDLHVTRFRDGSFTLEQHLREGTRCADMATQERTSGGDQVQCERGYRQALRHLVLAGEMLATPSAAEENTLSCVPVVLQGWISLCIEDR